MRATSSQAGSSDDIATVAAIAAGVILLTTALHEFLGHAASTLLLGGTVKRVGPFFVEQVESSLGSRATRIAAGAGVMVNVIAGVIAVALLRKAHGHLHRQYFLWMLALYNFVTFAGYLFISGIDGSGDLGIEKGAVLFQAKPESVLRIIETLSGALLTYLIVRFMANQFGQMFGGSGELRVKRAQRTALVAYIAGCVVCVATGLLQPGGLPASVKWAGAYTSIGGTSALAWMMQLLDRKAPEAFPAQAINRSMPWILASVVFVVVYAVALGPTRTF
jgi:hypothetical protein